MRQLVFLCVAVVFFSLLSFAAAAQEGDASWMKGLQYQGYDQDGAPSLSTPHMSDKAVLQWTSNVLADVMSLDFQKYNDQFKRFQGYFQATGWKQYADYIQKSGYLTKVVNSEFLTTAIVLPSADVGDQRMVEGSYHWLLKMPVMVSYFNRDPATKELIPAVDMNEVFVFNVQLGRVDQTDTNPDGLIIERWNVAPR